MAVGQGAVGPDRLACFLLHIRTLDPCQFIQTTPEIWRTHPDLVSQICWTLQWQAQINRIQTANSMVCSPLFHELSTILVWSQLSNSLLPTKFPSIWSDEDIAKMESRTTPIQEGEDDEDMATLNTPTLWSSPSCNSSQPQLPRHHRIQQTRRHCFGHNFLIRH
jgi:hypothetical protein